ncbi:MAG: LamG-like jellyroll fold domain-containing protein [Bacteroidota bacterium]
MKNSLLISLILILITCTATGQVDRTFWFAAPDVTASHGDQPIQLRISTFDQSAQVTISQPANAAFPPQTITVPANSGASIDLTAWKGLIEASSNIISNQGLLIESTELITAYYEVNPRVNPDIFALKGRNGLGTEFYLSMQQRWESGSYSTRPKAGAVIVATLDNTDVTITPTTNITEGASNTIVYPAGVPFTVTLNQGETFALNTQDSIATNMPTGTHITSTQAIAVTQFHDSQQLPGGCRDLAGDQLVPTDILGTEYIVTRGSLTNDSEVVMITATVDGTGITAVTGAGTTTITLNAGQSYEFLLATTEPRAFIQTTAPVYATHYTGFGCEQGMAILPPLDCTGSRDVIFFRSTSEAFWVTLLVPAGSEDAFSLNGGAVNTDISTADFSVVPGSGGAWMSARLDFSPTSTITVGSTTRITNSESLFHLGTLNGGTSGSGSRYGYFSSFNSVNLGPDININFGSTVTLDSNTPFGVSYLWNTGETTPAIEVGIWEYGEYWVQVDLGGTCILSDTICVGTIEYVWRGEINNDYGLPDNWSKACDLDGIPTCGDDVIIPASSALFTIDHYPLVTGSHEARSLFLEAGAELGVSSTGSLLICGDFIHQGTIGMQNDGEVVFGGSMPQTYSKTGASASGTFAVLSIDNSASFTSQTFWPRVIVKDISDHLYVSQRLQLNNGYLDIEADRKVIVESRNSGAVINHSVNSFVAGRLQRGLQPTGSYDLPVGLAEFSGAAAGLIPDPSKAGTLMSRNSSTTAWSTSASVCGGLNVLEFNQADSDYVQLSSTVAISGAQPRTIEMWARVDEFNNGGLFQLGRVNNSRQDFSLRTEGSVDRFRLQFWGTDLTGVNLVGSQGEWHHYALVYTGAQAELYYDGVLSGVLTVDLNTVPDQCYLGRWRDSYFDGAIANFKVWDYARTETEINESMCASYDCNNPPPAGLVAHYALTEGSGTTINTGDFDCPAPTMSYQLANVDFTSATTIDNLCAYFQRYPTIPGPTGQTGICGADFDSEPALNNGKWRIDAFNSGGDQVVGDGTYTMSLFPRDYTNARTSATVQKRDPLVAGDPWAIPAGNCVSDAITNPIRSDMSGFSEFGIAQTIDNILLPVEIVRLDAKPEKDFILIKWQTASEQNNAGFEVERSLNGRDFNYVGFVASSAGNSNELQDYDFPDYEVRPGKLYYYRLKQIDEDGSISYSKVVSARLEGEKETLENILVYPNPTNGILNVDLGTFSTSTSFEYNLVTTLGNTLQKGTLQAGVEGQIDLSTLPKGMYLLILTQREQRYVIKVSRW